MDDDMEVKAPQDSAEQDVAAGSNANSKSGKAKEGVGFFLKNRWRKIIGLVIILILFLLITNPSLLPFLSEDAKESVRGTWERVFGDVSKISQSITLNWATLFQVIAIILVMTIITLLISIILDHLKPKTPKGKSALTMCRDALRYITFIVGFFWCLNALGVNLSTIFASVGIVALIIGFGAQSLVEDMVTGVFLVFEDQFNVGDIIEVNGFRGTVDSIGIRTTAIRDTGDNVKLINNADLRNILNRSAATSLAVADCAVSYDADLEKVEKVVDAFLPTIRPKYPDVFVADPTYAGVQTLADSGVVLRFFASVPETQIFRAQRLLNREIKIAFDKAGIEIPFNQIVVHQAKD